LGYTNNIWIIFIPWDIQDLSFLKPRIFGYTMDILWMKYRRVTFYGIFNGLKLKGLPVTPSLQWQEIG